MATVQTLTLLEDNDETVTVTLTPPEGGSLAGVTALSFILKPSDCDGDNSPDAFTLTTTTDPPGITIQEQSADEIVATFTVPAEALDEPYPRVWRLDTYTGPLRRTAIYGPVTVVDL